ncbi:MAG: ribonuclease J [Patescibacteria group bacterium]|nr:MAG: ribonuclease J [Patescibacteria group bacterium]
MITKYKNQDQKRSSSRLRTSQDVSSSKKNETNPRTNVRKTQGGSLPKPVLKRRSGGNTAPKINIVPGQKVSTVGKLRIIPVGGCEEVGRNMTIFEYENDIVIVDMGLQFPEEDMMGIDYIIPNIEYLKGKERNIRGVIFSHGHLDHIGAAPILLERLGNPPIIGRPMTIAMVKHRVEDYKPNSSKNLKVSMIKNLSDKMNLGVFKASYYQVEHSIMDAVGIILSTPCGTVIHPGDWTMERDKKTNEPMIDYTHLAQLPRPTILMLESLAVVSTKPSPTAEDLKINLEKIIAPSPGRIIIGTFSSQVERVGWIIEIAERTGKKVALDGYSMKTNVEIARELGYIKAKKETFIKIDQIGQYPDNKIVIICTGAQGEENAVLSRVIDGSHRSLKIQRNDTIVLSSSIIPGNERTIQRLIDNLYRQCDNVIHGNLMDIHISGHGTRDDLAFMLKAIKPDYFIPVYGNYFMLKEAEKLAKGIGFSPQRIIVPDNGMVIEFNKQGNVPTKEKIPANYVFVDGMGVADSSHNIVLRDRKMMSEDGMIVLITTIDSKTGELLSSPDIISRGFVHMKESRELIQETRNRIRAIIKKRPTPQPGMTEDDYLKSRLRTEIGQFLFQQTKRRPLLMPVVIRV